MCELSGLNKQLPNGFVSFLDSELKEHKNDDPSLYFSIYAVLILLYSTSFLIS